MSNDDDKAIASVNLHFKNGQIVGEDLPSEEEQEALINELVELYKTNKIRYYHRKREVAALLGDTPEYVIDGHVKLLIKALETQVGGAGEKDDVRIPRELVFIALSKAELYRSPEDVFATFERYGHLEHHKIESAGFQDWLNYEYGELHKIERDGVLYRDFPDAEHLKKAIYKIRSHARLQGDEYEPRVRLNLGGDGALWLDLGRKDWQCVRVDADDWTIEKRCEAKVIRGDGRKELPLPEKGGKIADLREFVNVRDDDAFALYVGTIVGLFNTFGHYTNAIFCGPAGSGKTTAMRVMRSLVDPHHIMERRFRNERDLYHGLGHSHLIAYENVSEITTNLSDAICALNTGTGYEERKYYYQGEVFQVRGHHPVLINGIPTNLAEREDLLDRTVTFAFHYLGESVRSDDAFWRDFKKAWPKLLGCVLDGVVGALRSRRKFGDDNDEARKDLLGDYRTRFSDHVVWAEAACRALGFARGAFSEAYRNNQGRAVLYLAEHNPICVGIAKMIARRRVFLDEPALLYRAIKPYMQGLDEKPPGSASQMMIELPRVIMAMRKVYGIEILLGVWVPGGHNNMNGVSIRLVGTSTTLDAMVDGPEMDEPEPPILSLDEMLKMGTSGYYTQDKPEPPKPPTGPIVIRRR
jgi:hypothetical protein